jgi:hypothetical protein
MTTKLDKTIKREIEIDGQAYTVAISPEGVKLTQKGFRKGQEVTWPQLLAAGGGAAGGGAPDESGMASGASGSGFGAADLRGGGNME